MIQRQSIINLPVGISLTLCIGLSACGPRVTTPELASFKEQKNDTAKLQSLQSAAPDILNESIQFYDRALELHNDNEPEDSSYYIKLAQISWQTAERRAQYLSHRSKMNSVKTRLDEAQKILNFALKRKQELKDMQVNQAALVRQQASQLQENRREAEAALGQKVREALENAKIEQTRCDEVKAEDLAKGLYKKALTAVRSAEAAIQRGDFTNAERIAQGAVEDFKAAREAAMPLFEKEKDKELLEKKMNDLLREGSQISGASSALEARGVVITLTGLYRRGKRTAQADAILDQLVNLISKYSDLRLIIEGHTSSHGARMKKLQVSESMANEVMSYVKSQISGALKVGALGRGDYAPITDNPKSLQNERVDVVFFKPRIR